MTPLRRIGLAGLAVVALAACTSSGDDDTSPRPTTTSTSTSVSTTPSDGEPTDAAGPIGGSRYLAYETAVPGEDRKLVLVDHEQGREEVVVTSSEPFFQLDVRPDGAVAWEEVPDGEVDSVVRVLVPGADEATTLDPGASSCPRWLPDGRLLVLFADGRRLGVSIADPSTGKLTTTGVSMETVECAAPDGDDHVVLARPRAGTERYPRSGTDLVRVALDGGDEEVIGRIPPGCRADGLDVSPSGDRVVAAVDCHIDDGTGQRGIYVGGVDGEDLTPVVAGNEADTGLDEASSYRSPRWTADGTRIVYQHGFPDRDRSPELVSIDPTGGDPVIGPVQAASPALSRDGGAG